VLSVARYAAANVSRLVELDVNPIIVRPAGRGAVAVDTMMRMKKLS
jgi:acetate---CoA ligase (ADP-forming)